MGVRIVGVGGAVVAFVLGSPGVRWGGEGMG